MRAVIVSASMAPSPRARCQLRRVTFFFLRDPQLVREEALLVVLEALLVCCEASFISCQARLVYVEARFQWSPLNDDVRGAVVRMSAMANLLLRPS